MSALVGCGVAPLDRTGVIRCGTDIADGGCPTRFECRSGRCCPSDSPANMCPIEVSRDGSVRCPNDRNCPGGLVCTFDRCCPADGSGTGLCGAQRVGAACADDVSCGPGLRCFESNPQSFTRIPGGYCAPPTECVANDNNCGPSGVCVSGTCYARCIVTPGSEVSQCISQTPSSRSAYSCRRLSFDVNATDGACLPDCNADPSVCAVGSICQPDGFCDGRCTQSTECPGAQFECESSRCEQRFLACNVTADCNERGGSYLSCQQRPGFAVVSGRVCVLNRTTRCPDTPCPMPTSSAEYTVTYPCEGGECLVRVQPRRP
ncbi:MAG: hypothetical protein Q8Q09_16675 [Deltaproteobacteria bacterium]|nr:hypothetical protein [Deltaproteobacteria bacterium]